MSKFKRTILIQFEGKARWHLAYEKAPLFNRFINFDRSYQHLPGFRRMVIPYDPGMASSHRDRRGWDAVKRQWSLSRKRFIDTYLLKWLPRKKKAVVIAAINNNYNASMRLQVAERWPEFVDIFGGGWPKQLKNYCGFTASKIDLLKRYGHSLVLENQRQPGYITEKIMDSITAGAVPLYWGALDNHEYHGLEWVPIFNENTSQLDKLIHDRSFYRENRRQLTMDFQTIMKEFSPGRFHDTIGEAIQN